LLWIADLDPQFFSWLQVCPTDYGKFVLDALAHMAKTKQGDESQGVPSSSSSSPAPSSSIDQDVLRQCIRLSSSFLLTDSTMNAETGIQTWSTGMNRVVDIVLALDKKDVLEIETMTEVSRACTECWTAAGAFPGIADCRTHVRDFGIKLKKLLDPGSDSYKG
jgi:hypothetical protein